MKQPNGTSLEFNFYFADLPEPEPFIRLINGLLELGAEFTGNGLAAKGTNINGAQFADAFDPEPEAVEINDASDFHQIVTDPNRRLIEVTMTKAIYSEQNLAERVTYLSIPQKAAYINNHPLAIWTTWNAFSGIPEEFFEPKAKANQYRQIARKKGRQVYRRFIDLLTRIKPAYAAITFESFLLSPAALRTEPNSTLFNNFYLSNNYFSAGDLDMTQELYKNAYFEVLPDGLYISANNYFNPTGKELEQGKVSALSLEVAKLIGKRVR